MPRGNGGIIGPVNTSFSGVWSLTEAQLRRSANTWPNFYAALLSESATGSDAFTVGATADPYFEYTTLLLPGNGTNGAQNNTFLDGSTNNFTITRNGNTTQGTFSPFSQTGWGNYFGGGASNINLPSSTNFALGGAFSFECWVYQASIPNQVDLLDVRTSNEVGSLGISSTGFPRWQNGPTTGSLITGSTALTANQWNYLLFVADASGCSIYLNGTRGANTSQVATWPTSARPCFIAGSFGNASGGSLNGYVSDVRLIKGSTPYSSTATTVTVPTEFLPFVTNTVLQCCKSNRFVNTVSGTSMTTNGTTSVQAFSPFNPTASWSAATYGGSGYFDGNGDYLSAASNAAFGVGSGDFTIELWVYLTANFDSNGRGLITAAYDTNFAVIGVNSGAGNKIDFYVANTLLSTGTNYIALNTWTHLALVRSSGTTKIYFDGVEKASSGSLTGTGAAAALYVGTLSHATAYVMTGYLSSTRLVKGTAVYTGAFTPPSLLPLTNAGSTSAASYPSTTNVNTSFASSATSLLLNFTNAGIYDATSKNDLETVGNAQISTTQSKFGGSSISFDGTGDWLLIPDQPPQRIGTGNFTIEMWVYRNSSGTYGLAGKGTGTTGWLVSLNSSNQVVFTYGSSTITSSGTVSATTWTHIAVVREGTSTNQTKIYIGGSNNGTGTVSTDFNQTNSMYIGADRTGGSAANAYVQDVRITNYARYTANFTAPTAAFPTL